MKKYIFSLSIIFILLGIINKTSGQTDYTTYYKFSPLPYSYDDLEPYIDSVTMRIHYSKHHWGYYKKFIKLMKDNNITPIPVKEIFKHSRNYPQGLINMAGGYWNHTFFWNSMAPEKTEPTEAFKQAIVKSFGSWDNFEKEFKSKAKSLFGSGWTWLIIKKDGTLAVVNTPNQNNPLMQTCRHQGMPLLALDVWEHAYYLKYQYRRGDYINNFWKIINWQKVSERYQQYLKK